MATEFKTPRIVAFLEVVGASMIVLGLIAAVSGAVFGGLVAFLGGCLLSMSVIIRKVSMIEYHLRPKE